MDKSKALELYSFFVNEGYDLGDEQNFISALKDDKKRTELHGFFLKTKDMMLGRCQTSQYKKKNSPLR